MYVNRVYRNENGKQSNLILAIRKRVIEMDRFMKSNSIFFCENNLNLHNPNIVGEWEYPFGLYSSL